MSLDFQTEETLKQIIFGITSVVITIILFVMALLISPIAFLFVIIWMAIGITSIALIRSEFLWERISISILPSIVVFISFLSFVDSNDMEAGSIFGVLLLIVLGIQSMYWFGNKIQENLIDKEANTKVQLRELYAQRLNAELTNKNTAKAILEEYYSITKQSNNLIKLIDMANNSLQLNDVFVDNENQRFQEYRKTILEKLDEEERHKFPYTYADLANYYKQLAENIKKIENEINDIDQYSVKELKNFLNGVQK